jgi:hypothetical protein
MPCSTISNKVTSSISVLNRESLYHLHLDNHFCIQLRAARPTRTTSHSPSHLPYLFLLSKLPSSLCLICFH